MSNFALWISGQPFAQSRARVTNNGTYSSASKSLRGWRARIEGEILLAMRRTHRQPLEGPIRLVLKFQLPTTKAERWGQWCDHKPDCDNLAKAVMDCMEKAGLFKDDQQVCVSITSKQWSAPGEAGVYVFLEELGQGEKVTTENQTPEWLA